MPLSYRNDFTLFAMLVVLKYGVMFLLTGSFYAPIHDNLDSDVVYSVVAGDFWRSGFDPAVFDRFAGGSTKWYFYTQSFSPQTLFYTIFSPQIAYLLNELLGLFVAYIGMRLLLGELIKNAASARLFACLFAFSISFSTYGLGLSGAPYLLWLMFRARPMDWRMWGMVLLLGLSSNLAMHGVFLPGVLIALLLMTRRKVNVSRAILMTIVYVAMTAVQSGGIIYAILLDAPSHRTAWPLITSLASPSKIVSEIAESILILDKSYHAIYLPGIFVLFWLLAGFTSKVSGIKRATLWAFLFLLFVGVSSAFLPAYIEYIPSALRSIQFERLGLFSIIVFVCLAAMIHANSRARLARGFLWVGFWIYVGIVGLASTGLNPSNLEKSLTPAQLAQAKQLLRAKEYKRILSSEFFGGNGITLASFVKGIPTFENHFKPAYFACLKDSLPKGRVLSIGLDPMIAPYHGYGVIDGYHNFYPLTYKHKFRDVIAKQIAGSERDLAYYDDWGSRLISFVINPEELKIDFKAAENLGATAVISAFPLQDQSLTALAPQCSEQTRLYAYKISAP